MKKLIVPILISFGIFFSCSKKEITKPKQNKGFELSNTMLKTTTFAKVERKCNVPDSTERMFYVPSKAVIFNKKKYFVVVYKSQTNIKIAEIKILKKQRDTFYIKGLKEGENVILNNHLRIYRSLIN